jgi:predicted transcriptional regulator
MTDIKIEAARRRLLDAIREHMDANNITQEDAAKKTGFIQSNIIRMLAGKFPPTLDNLLILCEAVGLRLEVRSILYPGPDEG